MSDASFTDLLEAIIDNRGRTAPTAASGIPLIATNCIKEDSIYPVKEKVRYVDQHTHEHWFRGHPKPGDVLFVCKGSPGRVVLVPNPIDFCVAQDMVAVRANPEKIYPRFLFAALRSPGVKSQIASMHVGSLIPHFKKGDFDKLRIPTPGFKDQKFIGDLYFLLSEKIESNRRLTKLASAYIRVKILAALIDGCEEVAVARLANFVNGGAYTKSASGKGRMVIRIADLNSGPGASTVYNDIDVPGEKTARAGDILMSWSGSLGVYRWFREEAIVNQHIFKVIPTGYPSWLVFDRLDFVLNEFQGIAKDKTTTMGHIQRGHLESTSVKVPLNFDELESELGSLWKRLLVAEQESINLERLRDTLVPELLSGRLHFLDVKEEVV